MVTRSIDNYEKHKQDIHDIISRKNKIKADKFIKYYSETYDEHNRSFIDYKLAYSLMPDINHVKTVGTRWYAFVGVGGTGKSTLAKNVFYYLDKTFNLDRLTTEMDEFIDIISTFDKTQECKSALLDEPDDNHATNSKKGKIIRKIFGKIRQQKLFLGICATDLTDIPQYIYRKLDGIFFLPYSGKYMFFRNRPRKRSYIIQKIRKLYQNHGYDTFFKLKNDRVGCLTGDTIKHTPLDSQEKQYLKQKRKDYEKDINNYKNYENKKNNVSERDKIIINMKNKGLTDTQIADNIGLSRSRVTQIIGKHVNVKG